MAPTHRSSSRHRRTLFAAALAAASAVFLTGCHRTVSYGYHHGYHHGGHHGGHHHKHHGGHHGGSYGGHTKLSVGYTYSGGGHHYGGPCDY